MKKKLILTFALLLMVALAGYMATIEIGARRGMPVAQGELGRWYDQGLWLHFKNQEKALYWYEKSAKADYHKAQFNLGLLMQEQGRFERAAYWYARAAIQGFASAQYNLAVLFQEGKGVTKNLKTANLLFEKAALQGDEMAQYSLGIAYAKGSGIKADHS